MEEKIQPSPFYGIIRDKMKTFIVILIVVIAGFLAYTYFTSATEEEQKVRALEKEFNAAVGDFLRADPGAGAVGGCRHGQP